MFIFPNNIWKRRLLCGLLLIIIIFEFNFIILYAVATKQRDISGYSKKTRLQPDESVSYRFSNNIRFDFSTDVLTELDIEYDKKINNREISLTVRNNNPISLQIKTERSVESFGMSKSPKDPEKGSFQLRSQYKCVYRLRSNSSIEKLKLEFKKDSQYGIDPFIEYSIAVYEEDEDSWDLIDTEEDLENSNSDLYLKSSLTDLEADTDYYITIYEVSYWFYIWIGLLIISAISIFSLVVILS